jgi:hypothetical protein
MYICKYFRIEELVDKYTFEKWGKKSWQFFNPQALMMIDGIREYFDSPMYINNWLWGGNLQFRGLRPLYVDTGKKYSMHRFGGGFDGWLKKVTVKEAREEILKNKDHELLKHINCTEAIDTHLHTDVRNISDRIRIVG